MTNLPQIDHALMVEHLAAHEGVINKLQYYYSIATNPVLKEILALQIEFMLSHVEIMLAFINPTYNQIIKVPSLDHFLKHNNQFNFHFEDSHYHNRWITLEAHNGAKSMANQNYVSSLLMKNPDVKDTHVEMAIQQSYAQKEYEELISKMNWTIIPHSSIEDQTETFQYYSRVFH